MVEFWHFLLLHHYDAKVNLLFGTVKLAWIFTIEKLKTDDKSLMTSIWA
jgi:hypothetical protein